MSKELIKNHLESWGLSDCEIILKKDSYEINIYGDQDLARDSFRAGMGRKLSDIAENNGFFYNCSIKGYRNIFKRLTHWLSSYP